MNYNVGAVLHKSVGDYLTRTAHTNKREAASVHHDYTKDGYFSITPRIPDTIVYHEAMYKWIKNDFLVSLDPTDLFSITRSTATLSTFLYSLPTRNLTFLARYRPECALMRTMEHYFTCRMSVVEEGYVFFGISNGNSNTPMSFKPEKALILKEFSDFNYLRVIV